MGTSVRRRSVERSAVVLALLVAVVAWLPGGAGAVPAPGPVPGGDGSSVAADGVLTDGWQDAGAVQPGRVPPPPVGVRVQDVSCVGEDFCMAVGGVEVLSPRPVRNPALVLVFDGTAWAAIPGPSPVLADTDLSLVSVECWSPTGCAVLGRWSDEFGGSDQVSAWDGTSWSSPSAGQAHKWRPGHAVSCVAGGVCVAVPQGPAGAAIHDVADWTATPIPAPPSRDVGSVVGGLSCAAPDDCTFAGYGGVDRWDGDGWTTTPVTVGGEPFRARLLDCVAGGDCVAVGAAGDDLVGISWDGDAVVGTEVLTGVDELRDLACWAADRCVVLGASGGSATLVELGAGGWDSGPALPAGWTDVRSLDCHAASCVVGKRASGPTAGVATWDLDDQAWVVEQVDPPILPDGPDPTPDLTSVSCPAVDFCMASGNWADAWWDEPLLPLVQVWDGSTWSILPFDGPGKGASMGEGHVTSECGSPTHCRVLLDIHQDDDHYASASRWDGSSWTSLGYQWWLQMWSPGDLECVGDWCAGFQEDQLVELVGDTATLVDGFTWNYVGFSCPVAGTCTVLSEDGMGRFKAGTYTPPSGGLPDADDPRAISCAAVDDCVVVGGHGDHAAAWRVEGTTWTDLEVPLQGASGVLSQVSCPSVDECVALGEHEGAPVTALWVEGTWTVVEGGLPGHEAVAFADLDCVPGRCTAVGTAPTEPVATVVAAELTWEVPVATFPDVPLDHRFSEEIEWLVAEGIAGGYDDGLFRPTAPVSRQAMAAFLHRLDAATPRAEEACTEAPFDDVPADHRFCAEITWLVEQGIAEGYGDGTFRPTAPVSRQAAAAFLLRWAGSLAPACAEAPFPDVPAGHRFCRPIDWLVDRGIAEGYPDGEFKPTAPVSRQAAAAFLHRVARPGDT